MGILVIVLASGRNSEPSICGRPLGEWLAIASDHTKANAIARANAENAIAELGTSGIPFLLQQLETSPSWRERLSSHWNSFAINRHWWGYTVDSPDADETRELAVNGFEILGTNGVSAIPKLRKLMRKQRYTRDVARVFGHIQSDEALDSLIVLLKHSDLDVRSAALNGIGSFTDRENVLRAAQGIVPLVDDTNEWTARLAVDAVAVLLPASQAIPVLTQKFTDPRPTIVRGALGGFFAAGPHAEPVMPAIATMLTNSDETTRRIATNVLFLINPYRAPEFGIVTNGADERIYKNHHRVRQQFATNPVPYLHP